jgi:hypothetical protein
MANWLTDILGPTPAPQVVSMTRNGGAPMPPTGNIPGFDLASLIAKMQEESATANTDSLKQYKNLMQMSKGVQTRALGDYDQAAALQQGMGNTQMNQINQAETKSKGQSEQDLISRGLGNTTVRSSVNRGIEADATNARNSVAEAVANAKSGLATQRAGAEESLGNMRINSLLSRQNVPPNAQMYAALIQQLMANGGRVNPR